MKKIILLSICLSLSFSFLFGQSATDIELQAIGKSLRNAEILPREEPFSERTISQDQIEIYLGKAISYGCYREGQAPGKLGPSKAEIAEDLEIISQYWSLIRVYNADDDTERILQVIEENKIPLKVMLGIWLEKEENRPEAKAANIKNTLRAIDLAEKYNQLIFAVNVGNETQVYWSWHRMQTENLLRYIRAVRRFVSLPVTTADDYNFWNKAESEKLAAELDFIVTHIYPLWNGITLENSTAWLSKNLGIVKGKHPQKQILIGEIGWATKYNPDKKGDGEQGSLIKARVGLDAQSEFLFKFDNWQQENRVISFWFEAFDEPWKGGGESTGPNEIEKNWGLFYVNRTPKESFSKYINHKKNLKTNP